MKMQRLWFALIMLLTCGAYAAKDTCFDCHRDMEGMSLTFTNDIHYSKAISCAKCHGGDQNEEDQNISMSASKGFKIRLKPKEIPEFCGSCHSNTNFMSKYDAQLRTDQLEKYKTSVHGKALAVGNRKAAECGDCHIVHTTRAPSDPLSAVNPKNIAQTCGKCHASTTQAFVNSRHGRQFTSTRRPSCLVCHSAHGTQPATNAMLTGATSVCTPCHRAGSRQANLANEMAQVLADLEKTASKEALSRAKAATHSLNVQNIRRAAQETPPASARPN
jgi:predicted CXXCH cytochrome family protein